MSSAGGPASSFQPPGPGSWTLDTAHFPRPATRFVIELFPEPARRGFREATAGYGLLLDHIEWAFVHRWAYLCPRPAWPADGRESLTRSDWQAIVAAHPGLAERLATSAAVFDERRWRGDVDGWDREVKPRLRRAHGEIQAVEPSGLDLRGLWAHLERCREALSRAVYEHHRLNVAPVVPVGDFLVHAEEWTGRPAAELVGLVRAAGPDAGAAARELDRLAEAVRADPEAGALLAGDAGARAVLERLAASPGAVGQAAADYLGLVGHWSAGSGADVAEPRLRELPGLLVETIRAALAGGGQRPGAAADEHARDVRADVPAAHRRAFDDLLTEARASHRVRDERASYCDVWAFGLARRAILTAGRRLAEAGVLAEPDHLVEAGHAEMQALLDRRGGPSAEELAARARYRAEASEQQAPVVLGGPPRRPVPAEWLPPGAARTERAFRAYVAAMSSADSGPPATAATVRGIGASPGSYRGPARLVRGAGDLDRIQGGDVLVAAATTPAFNVALAVVGAVVTDRGGLLSHAAIVAREYGIPAVVGTGGATRTIPDGARVLVDGGAGEVTVCS